MGSELRKVLTVVLVWLVLSSSLAWGQSANERREIQRLFAVLNSDQSTSDQIRTSIIQLGSYRYNQVNERLLEHMEFITRTVPPRLLELKATLQAIQKTGNSQNIERVQVAVENFRDIIKNIFATAEQEDPQVYEQLDLMLNTTVDVLHYLPDPAPEAAELNPLAVIAEKTNRKSLSEALASVVNAEKMTKDQVRVFTSGSLEFMNQKTATRSPLSRIQGRDHEAGQILNVLVRIKDANPALIGPAGSGKKSTIQRVIEMINDRSFTDHASFHQILDNAEFVLTHPNLMTSRYLTAAKEVQKTTGKKLIIVVENFTSMSKEQIEDFKHFLNDTSDNFLRFMPFADATEFQNKFKHDPVIKRVFQQIPINEFSPAQIVKILKVSWLPRIRTQYQVQIDDAALNRLVEYAPQLYPDSGGIDAAIKAIQDIAIFKRTQIPQGGMIRIQQDVVFQLLKDRLGIPIDPTDYAATENYRDELLAYLNEEVQGQERMNRDLVETYIETLRPRTQKGVRVVGVLGRSGTGKTEAAIKLAARTGMGVLEVDGNTVAGSGLGLMTFFGAQNGILSSDKTAGTFYDFLDDPTRGKYGGVIIINEFEKASPEFAQRLMETWDKGESTGNDGKVRSLRRHIFILTSNRGDRILFPSNIEQWSDEEIQKAADSVPEATLKNLFLRKTSGKDSFAIPDSVLNRVHRWTVSRPISRNLGQRILRRHLNKLVRDFSLESKLDIQISEAIADRFVQAGKPLETGIRPIILQAQSAVERAIRSSAAALELKPGDRLHLDVSERNGELMLVARSEENELTFELPRIESLDPLDDDVNLQRLAGLEEVLLGQVKGQNEIVLPIVQAVKAHYGEMNNKKPLSFFVVGLTGTGKTELGRALAKGLHGDARRVGILPLGNVKNEADLNNILGSAVGYVGSQEISLFEKFLMENPDGGVLILDEASNMGGNDKVRKNELFKAWYDMVEEGRWVSNATGTHYDLSKYTFQFTGNDGENLFSGITADDLRLAIWENNRAPKKVREILEAAGVPPAFLGRMGFVGMLKPTIQEVVMAISRKLLDEGLKSHRDAGMQIHYDDIFVARLAGAFFSADMGARSVRNIIDGRIKSLVTSAVIKLGGRKYSMDKQFTFELRDNPINKPFSKLSDPVRDTRALIHVMKDGAPLFTEEINLSDDAVDPLRLNLSEALSTAFHEAGHAVMNNPRLSGAKLDFVTILGSDKRLGYARYETLKRGGINTIDEERMLHRLAVSLAGLRAQSLAGYSVSTDSGFAGDLESARKLVASYLITWGGEPRLQNARIHPKTEEPILSPQQQIIYDEASERIFERAYKLADEKLTENWALVRGLVLHLIRNGALTGAEFEEMSKRFEKSREGLRNVPRPRESQGSMPEITSPAPLSLVAREATPEQQIGEEAQEEAELAPFCQQLF